MEPDIQQCRAFVAAADSGSFAEASKMLGYSVSSVCRMVGDLERSCGIQVFDKGRFGVRLTEQGRELLPHARKIVSECMRFEEAAQTIARGEKGTLRIGAISSAATESLPRAMGRMLKDRPGISFELVPGDYLELERLLRDGRVDLGTLRAPIPRDLCSRLLFEDELVAVVPSGHPLQDCGWVGVEDLVDSTFIALERPEFGLSEVSSLLDSSDIRIDPVFSVWDDNAAMGMVEEGLGLTVLPETVTRRARFNVATVPIRPAVKRGVCLVWLPDSLSPLARAFLDYL